MRIATWNVNSLNVRLDRVCAWLEEVQPDVVCMQETKLADGKFPGLAFEALGYSSAHHGQGQWNGVALLSKVGLDDVVANFADGEPPDAEARIITGTCAGIRISSVYVPNGRSLDHEHYQYKLAWMARLQAQIERNHQPGDAVMVCGDFNIAPADIDVYNPAKFVDATHTSQPERHALARLENWGMTDVMRHQLGPDTQVFSWWDYRAGDFHQGRGLRIDLIMATAPLSERTTWCVVDRNARKGQQPSDHAPVLVDIDWPRP